MIEPVTRRIAGVLDTTEMRELRAKHAADVVREARNYRWVGIFDVGDEEIEIIGHTGVQAPAFVRFPVTQGLSGEAVRTRETVVSGAGSEMVVPILGAETGIVIGTLDVESERTGAFGEDDRRFLEACAQALVPLYE